MQQEIGLERSPNPGMFTEAVEVAKRADRVASLVRGLGIRGRIKSRNYSDDFSAYSLCSCGTLLSSHILFDEVSAPES